jgi:FtsP/CotA-like multicopper oxidase with cupredoxin domain
MAMVEDDRDQMDDAEPMEPQPGDQDPIMQDPEEARRMAMYWKGEIFAVEQIEAVWHKRGDTILKRYRDERTLADQQGQRRLNLLWASVEILKRQFAKGNSMTVIRSDAYQQLFSNVLSGMNSKRTVFIKGCDGQGMIIYCPAEGNSGLDMNQKSAKGFLSRHLLSPMSSIPKARSRKRTKRHRSKNLRKQAPAS